MRIVGLGNILIVMMIVLFCSCRKEGLEDYVSFRDDFVNNPEGFLEDYGKPYIARVDEAYFQRWNWVITVVSATEPQKVYYFDTKSLYYNVYEPGNEGNGASVGFAENRWANKAYTMEFNVYNDDPLIKRHWYKFGNLDKLILARKGTTLIFTRR